MTRFQLVAEQIDHCHFSLTELSPTEDLQSEWLEVQQRAEPDFFLQWPWIRTWIRNLASPPLVLRVRDTESSHLIGLGLFVEASLKRGCFTRQGVLLHQVGCVDQDVIAIEFNGLLCKAGREGDTLSGSLTFLLRHFPEIHLGGIPANYLTALEQGEKSGKWGVILRQRSTALRASLPLRSIPSKSAASQLARSQRLYEEYGSLAMTIATDANEAQDYWVQLRDLHQKRWLGKGHPGAFAAPFFRTFHRMLLEDELGRGVSIAKISAGSKVIGYLYNFINDDCVYNYQCGFLYEPDNRLKPGLVCHAMAMQVYADMGYRYYDFLAGVDRCKKSFADQGRELCWVVVHRRNFSYALENTLRKLKACLTPG